MKIVYLIFWCKIMNIFMFANTGIFPLKIGGTANVAFHLVNEWISLGHDVKSVIRVENNEEKKKLLKIAQTKKMKVFPFQLDYKSPFLLELILQMLLLFRYFFKQIKKSDIVHFNNPPVDFSLPFPFLAKLFGKKQIYHLQGGLFVEKKKLVWNILRILFKMQLVFLNKIIVSSMHMYSLAKKIGVDEKKLKLIPVGVNVSRFNTANPISLEGFPKIVFVGRLVKAKGVEVVIRSLLMVKKVYPNVKLYIIGEGSSKNEFKELTKKLGLLNNTLFSGFVDASILPSYYKSADICIFPSIYQEPFGIVLLEAMASEKPVIASNIGGMKEIIKNGVNGLLVEPGDWKGLAEAILYLTNNESFARKIAKNGYQIVSQKYDWKYIAKEFLEDI